MTLDREDIAAIAAEIARLLAPLIAGGAQVEPPRPIQPDSFAARRQEALQIAAQKGVVPGRKKPAH